ncbi:persephin [Clupea harengus]|uniref:Artemin n=1 Tax=Clupea harengus TaxID=7950 RepID=A0A6P3W4D4_CLUHA|nr:persephin [Clupea harengus]
MRSLLKLTVLLLCVQQGAGHWLRSLLEVKGQSASSHFEAAEDGEGTKAPGEATEGPEEHRGAPRSRRSADTSCSVQSLLIQVRDLGLGYDSDEMVLFKYCAGACPLQRSNHDLTLANLLQGGRLPASLPGQMWHSMPCCRPTHHEDMVFLDNAHRWHKVEKLSAAGCACVG